MNEYPRALEKSQKTKKKHKKNDQKKNDQLKSDQQKNDQQKDSQNKNNSSFDEWAQFRTPEFVESFGKLVDKVKNKNPPSNWC